MTPTTGEGDGGGTTSWTWLGDDDEEIWWLRTKENEVEGRKLRAATGSRVRRR